MTEDLIENHNLVQADNNLLQYSGRIDFSDLINPLFIYSYSSVKAVFTGASIKAVITNIHQGYDNYIGYIIDGEQYRILLSNDAEARTYTLADNLEDTEHTIFLFKRMDSCHYFKFGGFIIDKNANLISPPAKPQRKIEFYGDSVTAGEVSEAVDYVGKTDPPHNGEYSNSWYSYAALTARELNAEIHNIAQGGISLVDGAGFFNAPDYIGLESSYDKLSYNPYMGEIISWNFDRYTPHVVVIAVGQNDAHPENYMSTDYHGAQAIEFRRKYKNFVESVRGKYPNANIILTTTILFHDPSWDDAIEDVYLSLNDPKVHHFLYSNNGAGTPGHIRIPEAQKMAEELSDYINSLGKDIWSY